jgi:hypothetical protein
MLGAQGLSAGRDLYRATPTVTRDLGFSGLIQMTMFVCLYVYSRLSNFSAIRRLSALPVTGLQI